MILPIDDYRDPFDARRAHCYLPHSVQGFFANGGKRLYALRVMPPGAVRAGMTLSPAIRWAPRAGLR